MQRVIKSESLLVKLTLPANSETTVYLKVNNDAGIGLRVPLTLWQQDSLLAYKSMVNLLYGLLIGFVFTSTFLFTCYVILIMLSIWTWLLVT